MSVPISTRAFALTLGMVGTTGLALAAPTSELYVVENVTTATGGESLLAVAVDADGNAWLADGDTTVYYLPAGGSLRTFTTGVGTDMDVVRLAPDGTVVVSGYPATGWDVDGTLLWSASCGYGNPQGMDVGPDGVVYLSNRYELCSIDPSTSTPVVSRFGSYGQIAQALAVDAEAGDLFVSFGAFASTSTWSLDLLDASTGAVKTNLAGPGELYTNTGLADDGDRGLLIAERSSNTLQLLDDDGGLTELAAGFTRIGDVSIGLDGYIYITDPGSSTVYRLDRDPDDDGIDDLDDTCTDSASGAVVDADGCSGAQVVENTCGSASDWKNLGQYVSCVTKAANDAVKAGLLTNTESSAIKVAAAGTGKKTK